MQGFVQKENNPKYNKINVALLILIFFTSSFEVVSLDIGGFILKPYFVISVLLTGIWLLNIHRIKIKLYGGTFFLVWLCFLFLFLFNTNFIGRNILYLYSLVQSLLIIFITTDTLNTEYVFKKMLKWYLASFVFVALFGLLQFVVGFGGMSLLTQQWWVEGSVPRINGFSYEPSYFSTYLIIGWSILFWINTRLSKKDYDSLGIGVKKIKMASLIVATAIILSSSRIGIVFMITIYLANFFFKVTRDLVFKKAITIVNIRILFISSLLIAVVAFWAVRNFDSYSFLLDGTGVGDAASHSVDSRTSDFDNTLQLATRSVFIGVGLGGVPSAIAQQQGKIVTTNDEAKNYEGLNIFLEIFASSSLLGFLFFIGYLGKLFLFSFKSHPMIPQHLQILLQAFGFALMIELLILMFNQNILRAYVWVHIAMLNSLIFIVIKKDKATPDVKVAS